MGVDVTQPINLVTLKKLIRNILGADDGEVIIVPHAKEELEKDGLTGGDALNVLRGGVYTEPEWREEAWRYRSEARGIAIIFELESETCCIVITGWKFTR